MKSPTARMKRARVASNQKIKELGYKSMLDLDDNGNDEDKRAVKFAYDFSK
jgi:hypothetical protein